MWIMWNHSKVEVVLSIKQAIMLCSNTLAITVCHQWAHHKQTRQPQVTNHRTWITVQRLDQSMHWSPSHRGTKWAHSSSYLGEKVRTGLTVDRGRSTNLTQKIRVWVTKAFSQKVKWETEAYHTHRGTINQRRVFNNRTIITTKEAKGVKAKIFKTLFTIHKKIE